MVERNPDEIIREDVRLRYLPFVAVSVTMVSLIVGVIILVVYYSDKQHAISRADRQILRDKESRFEGTLIGHGMAIERIQDRLDRLQEEVSILSSRAKSAPPDSQGK